MSFLLPHIFTLRVLLLALTPYTVSFPRSLLETTYSLFLCLDIRLMLLTSRSMRLITWQHYSIAPSLPLNLLLLLLLLVIRLLLSSTVEGLQLFLIASCCCS
jgi:hypothetical protein